MFVIEVINGDVYFLDKYDGKTVWTNSLREARKFKTKEDARKVMSKLSKTNIRIKDISTWLII